MRVVVAALLAALAAAGVPHPAPDMPSGWGQLADPVSADQAVELLISLKQTNLEKLFDIAQRVSNPKSDSYGQYLTSFELESLTAPTAEHESIVENWLNAAHVPYERFSRNVLKVGMNVSTAALLLKTRFTHVANNETGQSVVQAGAYELPADVEGAISAIYGMHGFPLPPTAPSSGPAKVDPSVIGKTYDVSGVTPSGSERNRQAVAEFQGQTMRPNDLSRFFKKYVPDAPASAAAVHKYVPKSGVGSAGIEASLDIEYIMGVAPGVLTEFWYWKGDDFCKDLQQWTSTILAASDTPLVHSVSYGWQGPMKEIGCKNGEVSDVDANFAKLAAKGITIIFASGDSGSGYNPVDNQKKKLYPSWPASSPWVTAVGSTRFQGQIVGHPEMATDQFGSGGGFSTMFEAFDAQKAAVAKYLENSPHLPPKGTFPPGGRATPDVAALGEGFQVIADGHVESVGGTSASAPTFAGIVSLLNEARFKAGKPAMGYLNPWLYMNPDAFTDITVGTNAISRGGTSLGKYGFPCTKGWDPVTGLGTPIFSKMLSAALANRTSEVLVV